MKTLVLYATKYGTTKALAEKIAAQMPGEALAADAAGQPVDLHAHDAVILGTAIYIGKPRREMKRFVQENMQALLQKKVGLFLCCLQDEDASVSQQFQNAFPKELRDHAAVLAALGGIVDRRRLKTLDSLIMRMVTASMPRRDGVISTLSEDRIQQLVALMTADPEA